jgi:hypothetical protein
MGQIKQCEMISKSNPKKTGNYKKKKLINLTQTQRQAKTWVRDGKNSSNMGHQKHNKIFNH